MPLGLPSTRHTGDHMADNDARQHRTILRTLVLVTIISVTGVLFTAGTASAVTPDCLRAGEPAGPCAQELEFPTGFSSGGHFALLLGANRPSLDCVVAEGAPSRLHHTPGPQRPADPCSGITPGDPVSGRPNLLRHAGRFAGPELEPVDPAGAAENARADRPCEERHGGLSVPDQDLVYQHLSQLSCGLPGCRYVRSGRLHPCRRG